MEKEGGRATLPLDQGFSAHLFRPSHLKLAAVRPEQLNMHAILPCSGVGAPSFRGYVFLRFLLPEWPCGVLSQCALLI